MKQSYDPHAERPGDPYAAIRAEVAKLCAEFPGSYWRELDRAGAYPDRFVKALGGGGWLAALVPEEYGGSGLPLSAACAILEEIQLSGGNGGACHAQMYIMGALLRHGSAEAQKQAIRCRSIAERRAYVCRLSASPNRPPAPTPPRSENRGAKARAMNMSSTARKSGPRGPSIRI